MLMVADMESDRLLHDELVAAERAAAAPYLAHPPTPWWYPPAAGAWFAGLVLSVGLLGSRLVWFLVAVGALMGLLTVFVHWYSRRWGTWPSLKQVPREIKREMNVFTVSAVVLAIGVIATMVLAGTVVAAIVTFLLGTALVTRYEHTYRRAAAEVRERLG